MACLSVRSCEVFGLKESASSTPGINCVAVTNREVPTFCGTVQHNTRNENVQHELGVTLFAEGVV